jgi:SAM-dependent methyltransferase
MTVEDACVVCHGNLVPWFEKIGRSVYRCPTCRHIQVPAGVVCLADGTSIYEAAHSEVFEGHGNIDYYLDEGTALAAQVKLEFVQAFAPPGGTLLDVGASFGHFLATAGRAFRAVGVELNPTAVAWSRRELRVENFVGSLYALPPEVTPPFDVISAWDVIEHLDDPRGALAFLRTYLKPGGWLFLSTPDAGAWTARVLGSSWYYQDPVQHVNLFSRANLVRLLRESGFEIAGSRCFGRRYRVRYVVNRLAYLAGDHPARHLVGLLKRLPERVLRSSVNIKLGDVMGLAAQVRAAGAACPDRLTSLS